MKSPPIFFTGVVPFEPERVELTDGETSMTRTYPTIAMHIECGKNTDFNYGPWADRQRSGLCIQNLVIQIIGHLFN